MNSTHVLAVLFFGTIVTLSNARIPSLGLNTAESVRSKLPDSAFRIKIQKKGLFVSSPIWNFNLTTPSTFPALAGTDVQSSIVRVFLKSGGSFFTHYHPRAAETFIPVEGTYKVSFQFEGLGKTRTVTNVIKTGEVSVFPLGLVHDISCTSRQDCLFYALLDSADPGIVRV